MPDLNHRSECPTVSVIVPLFNDAQTVGHCLAAVQAQTRPVLEVVVVDDASTDESAAVAARHECRLISLPANAGPAVSRNVGAEAARGEILFFVDADVALAPDAVESAVAILTTTDVAADSVCGITDKEPLLPTTAIGDYRILQSYYWRTSSVGVVTPWFSAIAAIRRSVFLGRLGGLNSRLRQTEEIDFGVRLSRTGRVLLTSRVVGRHNDEHRLLPLMRKLWRRARLRVPLYVEYKGFMTGFETRSRALGQLAGALGLLTLPMLFSGGVFALTPMLLLAAALLSDGGFHRFLLRERGLFKAALFSALHLVTALAVTAGAAAGVLQWMCSGRFRKLYDERRDDVGATPAMSRGR